MNQKLILENWRRFLKEEDLTTSTQVSQLSLPVTDLKNNTGTTNTRSPAEQKEDSIDIAVNAIKNSINTVLGNAKKQNLAAADLKPKIINFLNNLQEAKKKKSGDRCTRIAKRKYDVWPSAYASGAVVKCRQGKIWKGVSENASDQEIDDALLLEEIEVLEEKWSDKYKRSIDCKNPKGFSQKAHCQGKKKNEDIDLGEVEVIEEAKKKDFKPNFSKEKEQGLHGWFARNDGKGWVNCRTGGPCGRDSADKGGKYPACRPTKAQCKSAGKGPLRKKKSSSPISWTKKKKKD